MKFVSYNLVKGIIVEETSYLGEYLLDHGVEKITNFDTDDFYIIDAFVTGFNWFESVGIDYLDKKMLQDLREKKAGLIINCELDTYSLNPTYQKDNNPNIVKFFRVFSKLLKIDTSQMMYIDSSYKTEKILKKYSLNGSWFNLWEYFLQPIDDVDQVIKKISNKEKREKKFLYFGGKARDYRLRFLNSCFKIPNFKENSYYSSAEGYFIDTETKEPKWMDAQILDLPNINGGADQWQAANLASFYHLNSYLNIVPMSYYYLSHDRLEINEKLFKPIAALQPFIVLGEIGTLKILRELGYKTFDKWIDESYDSTLDDDTRYKKILNEVTRLGGLSTDSLNDMLYDMLPTLIHNYELKKNRTKNHTPDLLNKIKAAFNQTS